jgi:cell division protein FtsX
VSQRDAYHHHAIFAGDPTVAESLASSALPASLVVEVSDPAAVDSVLRRVAGRAGIPQVNVGGDAARRFVTGDVVLSTGSFVATVVLLLGAAGFLVVRHRRWGEPAFGSC